MSMKTNTSISLDSHFTEFVGEQTASGRYASTSEVIRAGLRLLEERELKNQALRQALLAGEASGKPTPIDFDAFIAQHKNASSVQFV